MRSALETQSPTEKTRLLDDPHARQFYRTLAKIAMRVAAEQEEKRKREQQYAVQP